MRIPLLTLSAWLLIYASCTGFGLWIQQRFIKRSLNWDDVFDVFWIGWVVCIVVLQLWHYVLPISKLTLLFFSLIALVCTIQVRASLQGLLRSTFQSWRQVLILLIGVLLLTVWLIPRVMFSASVNDHAIYYLQTEKWFAAYPIVPGLGNLHGRLAFNSSDLLFTSLFQSWFGLPRAFHAGNGLLMLVVLLQLLYTVRGIWREGGRAPIWKWFCLLSLVPLIQQLVPNWRIGWTTDFPTFLLGIVITVQVLRLIQAKERLPSEVFYRLALITLLAAVGVTVKISFSVWCFGLLMLTLIIYRHEILERRRIALLAAILMIVIVPWIGRNIILSGYLVYPISATALPVSWRIPVAGAVAEARAIYGWARLPNENFLSSLENWDWLGSWFRNLTAQTFEVILPSVIVVIALLRIVIFRKYLQPALSALWVIPFTAVVSLGFWFFTTPDVRFAGALFWLLASGLCVIALTTLSEQRRMITLVAVVGISGLLLLGDLGVFTERGATSAPMDTPPLQQVTRGSDTIYAPVTGDRCGDAPLPCAPGIPNSQLRLRTAGSLKDGFWITTP